MADPYKKKNKEFAKSWKSAAKFGTATGGVMFAFIWSTFSVLAWVLKAFFSVPGMVREITMARAFLSVGKGQSQIFKQIKKPRPRQRSRLLRRAYPKRIIPSYTLDYTIFRVGFASHTLER